MKEDRGQRLQVQLQALKRELIDISTVIQNHQSFIRSYAKEENIIKIKIEKLSKELTQLKEKDKQVDGKTS